MTTPVVDPRLPILGPPGFDFWFPTADPAKLRDAAEAWRAAASCLSDVDQVLASVASGIEAANQGDAADAFTTWWQGWSASDRGYLPTAVAYCGSLAGALDGFASDVDAARRALEEAGEWFTTELAAATSPATEASLVAEMQSLTDQIGGQLAAAGQSRLAQSGVTQMEGIAPIPPGSATPIDLRPTTVPTLGTAPDFSILLNAVPVFGALAGVGGAAVTVGAPGSGSSGGTGDSGDPGAGFGDGAGLTAAALPGTFGPLTSTPFASAKLGIVSPPHQTAGDSAPLPAGAPAPITGSDLGSIPFSSPASTVVPTPDAAPAFTPAPTTTDLGRLASSAATRVPTGARGGSSVPFVPMGGMGGGAGGGDDGDSDEGPTRRRSI